MRRRRVVIALVVFCLLPLGMYVFARVVLGSDLVRSALEQQLSARLGQPVRIRTATAAIFPRIALDLHDVSIGEPAAVQLEDVRIVTGLRGLLSRVVADAEVVIRNGRVTLPLPFALADVAASSASGTAPSSPFTVTSVRLLALRELTLRAGQESITIDLESSIQGDRLLIHRLTARARTTRLEASGELASLARVEGTLEAAAEPLDLDEMMAIGSAFTSTAGPHDGAGIGAGDPAPMHIVIELSSPSGVFTTYTFTDLATTLDLVPGRVVLAPLSVRTFGGGFQGRLDADTTRQVPELKLTGRLEGLHVPALMKASGSPGGITGRLGGTVSLTATGRESVALIETARGTIDAAITDGAIPGLDMVRTVVLAFGKPSGAPPQGSGSAFSRLGGRFALAGGKLTSDNLAMASRDFAMAGRGSLQIRSGQLNARADVVLSEGLTLQAGTDLRRYAQEDGRVVVPATITGTLERPAVSLDLAAATRRALGNEIERRAKSLFDKLFKRKE